jgi:hypothetical protein
MIPKASQRGGGQQLATHLLNEYDNDRVEVAQLRGAIADDLHGAFAEWRAMSRGTQCRKYLYSLSLNPDPQQGPLDRTLYLDFIKRTEQALGLTDQPRAVVFHVKHGREHCHVVWSRIDADALKAVQLSHDRQKLRSVARDFAREHNLILPPGMQKDRGRDRYKDRAKRESLAEKQQEERSGITKEERRAAITAVWRKTKTGAAFVRALEESGYYLARGDRRSYVVVDGAGEIHSLSRQIEGATTTDIKARLARSTNCLMRARPRPSSATKTRRSANSVRTRDGRVRTATPKPTPAATPSLKRRRSAVPRLPRSVLFSSPGTKPKARR